MTVNKINGVAHGIYEFVVSNVAVSYYHPGYLVK